jgi:hypothetical protein
MLCMRTAAGPELFCTRMADGPEICTGPGTAARPCL